MTRGSVVCALLVVSGLCLPAPARAQGTTDRRWSFDAGLGWDNGISGNINSGAIGKYNGVSTVILKNQYDTVYGTGLHFRFGGGYLLDEETELRVTFTLQSLDADLTRMGDYGASPLYGQYDDYQSFALDVGVRRYLPLQNYSSIHPYGEATIGLGFIDEIDVKLSAPAAGLTGTATDFYDQTAAFTLGGNVGVLFDATPKVGIFTQIGLRYVTGLSAVDALANTGLETINDKSARWSMPFSAGVRVRF
jgi:hypothetical protein